MHPRQARSVVIQIGYIVPPRACASGYRHSSESIPGVSVARSKPSFASTSARACACQPGERIGESTW
ncbi:hypothetical protein BLA50215_00840 [Burkholderia lata]|nr:hypothetical protein BLA50215_00840 [Burkholderia lata]